MKKLLVYDLNKTLYRKSSKNEFFRFLVKKKSSKAWHIFKMLYAGSFYSLGLSNKTWFKQRFYSYLNGLNPSKVEAYSREYWNGEFPHNFRQSFLDEIIQANSQGNNVFVITGAYEVYTKYLEEIIPVKVIGTKTVYKNGKYLIEGKACNDEEKVERLKREAPKDYKVLRSYSDDDEAILYIAEKGFYVVNNELIQVQNKNRREFTDGF